MRTLSIAAALILAAMPMASAQSWQDRARTEQIEQDGRYQLQAREQFEDNQATQRRLNDIEERQSRSERGW